MQFFTPKELADIMKVPMTFIYEHTRKGSSDPIPGAFKFGKHLRFSQEAIEKWIKKHEKK
jgi:excisionase family DNA binding protein